jgi:hypothetical protein
MTTALERVSGQHHALAVIYTPGKDPVPIVHEAGWPPEPVWTAENLAPPGFDRRTIVDMSRNHKHNFEILPALLLVQYFRKIFTISRSNSSSVIHV